MNDKPSQSRPELVMSEHLSGLDQLRKSEPHFALDLYQVASLFDEAELPRNRRSLSRYCTRNKLDCEKVETLNGEEWRVDEQSVHRLIAQIEEQQRLTHQVTPGHAQPSHRSEMPQNIASPDRGHDQTSPDSASIGKSETAQNIRADQPGQDETEEGQAGAVTPLADERLLMQSERENGLLRDQLEKKDQQIENKDKQIDDLIERGREDKLLIQNFQRKLGMLEAPEQDRPLHTDPHRLSWQSPPVDNSSDS